MVKRKGIGKKARFEVFKRDGFTCVYCGNFPPEAVLHCDHVVPVAEGGQNDIDNLVTACDACNFGKGARPLNSLPSTISEKHEILEEREAQIQAYNKLVLEKRQRIEEVAWLSAEIFIESWGKGDSIRADWFRSIERFADQMYLPDLLDATNIAVRRFPHSPNSCFRYFCGVCWNKIKDSED